MRPKTCYCQQQSSQYPIFPSQARDKSFTRVARNETKYKKILDAADFARRENCSFIRLNDAFRKTLLKAAKKTLRQPTMRAEFSLIRAPSGALGILPSVQSSVQHVSSTAVNHMTEDEKKKRNRKHEHDGDAL